MRVLATCIVISALVHCILATAIVGEGGSAVVFTGTQNKGAWGEFDSAIGQRGSWTIELWFMATNLNNMPYKPIISQYTAGDQNNKFAGFDLQIWPNGQLVFFMGNGTVNSQGFGIFWFDTALEHAIVAGEWYHVAVVFTGTDVAPYTPSKVQIYVDGELRGASLWNGGSRQASTQPIRIARFDNQDPGVQSFAGIIDDVRFWDHARTQEDLTNSYYLNRRLDSDEEGLLAYFTFDEETATLVDVTGKYSGLLSTPVGGEPFDFEWSPIPLHTWVEAYNNATEIITLAAQSTIEDATILFSINQLPTKGKLFVVDAQGRVRDRITMVNIANLLPTNKVAYLPDTPSFVNDYDMFTYYANDGSLSTGAGVVHIYVLPGEDVPGQGGCDGAGGVIDECGVCNGNGLNCTCVGDTYRSYTLAELDRILVHYNIEYTLDLIHALETTLDDTLDKLYSTDPDITSVDLAAAVEVVQEFNSQCLSDFKSDMEDFLDDLVNNRQY